MIHMTNTKIGNLEVNKGCKGFGFIDVDTSSMAMNKIPLVIFNGAKPGPTLCLLGGVHGLEYSSIEGLLRVIKEVDPAKLSGILLAAPVVNQASFEARTAFVSPLDGLNLNRCFPGDPHGTMSYRVAHRLFSEVVSKADYLIDCHGGDLNEDICNLAILGVSDKEEVNKAIMEIAACFKLKYSEREGVFKDLKGEAPRGTTHEATKVYGIPSIIVESGKGGEMCESSAKFFHDGITNVMKHLGMIEGKAVRYDHIVDPQVFKFKAEKGGIFRSKAKVGEMVSAGDVVVEVTDIFERPLQTVRAPADSFVSVMRVLYAVNPGECLVWLTKLK